MKFEVRKSKGQWRWHLKADNNEIVASSERYKNKGDCLSCVKLIQSPEVAKATVAIEH